MNNLTVAKAFTIQGAPVTKPINEEFPAHGIGDLLAALRRQRLGLVIWVLVCLSAAALYLATTPPQFVASTLILLEPVRPPAGTAVADGGFYQTSLDAAQADSHMQIVKSERLLRFVFDTLKLADTPEFAPAPPGLRKRLLPMFTQGDPPTKEQLVNAAFLNFMGRVGVRRIGISYVLEITYTASTPALAASTVNSITSAYILDEVQSARRGSEYTQDRISNLKAEETAARQSVEQGTISDMRFTDSDARVISAAIAPTAKAFPQTTLVCAFAACMGLVTGLGFVFARHSVDRRIRTRRELPSSVACISVIPALSRVQLRRREAGPGHLAGPHFNPLRSALPSLMGPKGNDRSSTIGITSWRAGEGKSAVALSLAHLMAAAGEDVVLVDANLRDPVLSEALAPLAPTGLSEALSKTAPVNGIDCVRVSEHFQFVRAVGHGRKPDGNLFLGSPQMRRRLDELAERGSVIVDLPAMDTSSDTAAIGALLDGVMIVVEANTTTFGEVQDALSALRAADCAVLGIILNKVRS